ncbi:hypothetical protein IWQ60_012331 [Tieghemiomyces parasiticus]|uniref:Methionine aminopeptidase n=1 Tax=Tieghemiomyces parasiticus TaxID=78921 RepID=A0A9W8DKU2_9FUNG|nr:hypothetical protein IWQ60_012331 [Tieghemiomyces parasiticus]
MLCRPSVCDLVRAPALRLPSVALVTRRGLRTRPRAAGLTQPQFGTYNRLVPTSLFASRLEPFHNVPTWIPRPTYAQLSDHPTTATNESADQPSIIRTPDELQRLRRACKLAAQTLAFIEPFVKAGTTTQELDHLVYQYLVQNEAYPSPLNYQGFPAACCTSVNNVMAHGIPDDRPLQDGDLINIDITAYKDGFHGDTSRTFMVGGVDAIGRELVNTTREALDAAVAICRPGVPFNRIGDVISKIARARGLSVSQQLAGHGIGAGFHMAPSILHHVNDEPGTMEPGMVFTIEPVLCQGDMIGIMWPDRWTVATRDGGRSAQFEHTILVNATGHEILTRG